MSDNTTKNRQISADASGLVPLAILALVSTYIADQRPEGDRLGWWAEIAQAISVSFLVIGAVLTVIILAFALVAVAFSNDKTATRTRRRRGF